MCVKCFKSLKIQTSYSQICKLNPVQQMRGFMCAEWEERSELYKEVVCIKDHCRFYDESSVSFLHTSVAFGGMLLFEGAYFLDAMLFMCLPWVHNLSSSSIRRDTSSETHIINPGVTTNTNTHQITDTNERFNKKTSMSANQSEAMATGPIYTLRSPHLFVSCPPTLIIAVRPTGGCLCCGGRWLE